jgi:hypothetical protein
MLSDICQNFMVASLVAIALDNSTGVSRPQDGMSPSAGQKPSRQFGLHRFG